MAPPAPSQCQVAGCTYKTKENLPTHEAVHNDLQLHVKMVHILSNPACFHAKFNSLALLPQSCSPLPPRLDPPHLVSMDDKPLEKHKVKENHVMHIEETKGEVEIADSLDERLCQALGESSREPDDSQPVSSIPRSSTPILHNNRI